MKEEFWENYGKRNGQILQLVDILAKTQTDDNGKFSDTGHKVFDKHLDDISLYRADGKFITSYHAALYNKRKNGTMSCPVFDISFQAYMQGLKNKAYIKKVKSSDKSKAKEMKLDLIWFDDAYEEFVNEYLKTAFQYTGKEFIIDGQNKSVIVDLLAYFTRQFNSKLDLHKGICLYGSIGSGKSQIMKMLSKFTKDKNLETQFDFIYMDDVYSDCDTNGLESLDSYKFRACAFDDIGMRADNNVNNYGTKINAYRELVRRQYTRFTRPIPSLSHYTTNIPYGNKDHTDELEKAFGSRELDRFREMVTFVYLGGPSRRK